MNKSNLNNQIDYRMMKLYELTFNEKTLTVDELETRVNAVIKVHQNLENHSGTCPGTWWCLL